MRGDYNPGYVHYESARFDYWTDSECLAPFQADGMLTDFIFLYDGEDGAHAVKITEAYFGRTSFDRDKLVEIFGEEVIRKLEDDPDLRARLTEQVEEEMMWRDE